MNVRNSLDIYDPAHSDTSIPDHLHERRSIDTIDEESRVGIPSKRLRLALEITDCNPRITVTRRFYARGEWVASARTTYATASLSVRHRYSTLHGIDEPGRFEQTVSQSSDDRWLY